VGVHLRKELAGNTSNGYKWAEDGAVVEVADEHAAELLAIGGFEVVEAPEKPKRAPRHSKSDDAE
jgi:hypothetical protein